MSPTLRAQSAPATDPTEKPANETVVLLHGLGLGSWAMKRFEAALKRDGYQVVNLSYSSRRVPLEQLADTWLPQVLRESGAGATRCLHFVTHSMGGILLRLWLRDHAAANLGHVVMLAPPNAGSEVVDHLIDFPPFRWITSVNGRRLGTGPDSLPRSLGPWPLRSRPTGNVPAESAKQARIKPAGNTPAESHKQTRPELARGEPVKSAERADPQFVEQARPELVEWAGRLGIIAGNRSFNPLFSAWLPGPNDGKVSVSSARLAGMSDFLILPHSHTWLQWRSDTIAQTLAFLLTGRFAPLQPLRDLSLVENYPKK